jgi:hypothetical protein
MLADEAAEIRQREELRRLREHSSAAFHAGSQTTRRAGWNSLRFS